MKKKKYLAVVFNLTLRYIDGVLPINDVHYHSYLGLMHPIKFEISSCNTIKSYTSASYFMREELIAIVDMTRQIYIDIYLSYIYFPLPCLSFSKTLLVLNS